MEEFTEILKILLFVNLKLPDITELQILDAVITIA